jgi:hypothetical protein
MDGIKFEQGAIKTESRSSCADAGDFCGSMGCSYFPGMNAKAQAIFICRFVGESHGKSKAPIEPRQSRKRESRNLATKAQRGRAATKVEPEFSPRRSRRARSSELNY